MQESLRRDLTLDPIVKRLHQAGGSEAKGTRICCIQNLVIAVISGIAGARMIAPVNPAGIRKALYNLASPIRN